ncbi:UNVERIFIED_CONTAM: hypothetical protein HDU68_002818 [Siphonaria sp. JEL0065]|nr:hypothetical protein HDU68_002818 [Siphonaria sp. JEL0065]
MSFLLRRGFATSAVRRSLFTDHIARVKPTVATISVNSLDTILLEDHKTAYLFDVREPYEWNEERIPTAKYTGRGFLEKLVESEVSSPSDEILLYCSNGNRSLLAAEGLKAAGYQNVKYLDGGISAWKNANKSLKRNIQAAH